MILSQVSTRATHLNGFLRFPYEVATLAAGLVAGVVPPTSHKLGQALRGRIGAAERFREWAHRARDRRRPLLWVHAASVGEGLMAAPVIRLLRERTPELQVAYTYFSPSAERFANSAPADVTGYLPFDTSAAARVMLDALAPAALVFSKLDVWPLLVREAQRRTVPVALISAAVGPRSGRTSVLARLLLRDAYAALTAVGAAHRDDAERLVDLGVAADRVTVTGDTRYDQVWARVTGPSPNAELVARLRSDRPTLVAGSTWAPDEQLLFGAWRAVRRAVPRARLILAPHEPDPRRTAMVRAWAAARPFTVAGLDAATADTDVILVDRMGVLADLYALATASYVGGGLHNRGLHSVVEPAAHGSPVLFGPRGVGSRDADLLAAAGGAFVVGSQGAAAECIVSLFTDGRIRGAAGEKARGVIAAGLGAADRSAALVERLLRP